MVRLPCSRGANSMGRAGGVPAAANARPPSTGDGTRNRYFPRLWAFAGETSFAPVPAQPRGDEVIRSAPSQSTESARRAVGFQEIGTSE